MSTSDLVAQQRATFEKDQQVLRDMLAAAGDEPQGYVPQHDKAHVILGRAS